MPRLGGGTRLLCRLARGVHAHRRPASDNHAAGPGDAVRVRTVAACAGAGRGRGEVDHRRLASLHRFYRGDAAAAASDDDDDDDDDNDYDSDGVMNSEDVYDDLLQ